MGTQRPNAFIQEVGKGYRTRRAIERDMIKKAQKVFLGSRVEFLTGTVVSNQQEGPAFITGPFVTSQQPRSQPRTCCNRELWKKRANR
jgi:hypothetical protein